MGEFLPDVRPCPPVHSQPTNYEHLAMAKLTCSVPVIILLLIANEVQCNKHNNGSCPSTMEPACLPVGEAFNLFHNYGFLALSIQVAPLILLPSHLNASGSFGIRSNVTSGLPTLFHIVTHPILDRKKHRTDFKRVQINNPR